MEITDAAQLSYLVDTLTANGKHGFDKPNLKKLKMLCKNSNDFLEEAFRLMYSQLAKDHSEIRLSTVLLIDEFFQRSHQFRTLLLGQFDEFLELAAGTNFDSPLPEPKSAAQELMKCTVKCVHKWHEKYGAAYKRLSLGYNFLRNTKKVRLIDAGEVQTEIQRNAAEYKQAKKEEQFKQKLKTLMSEISVDEVDIKICIAELEACISLLVPKLTETDDSDEVTENQQQRASLNKTRASGIISQDYSITLDMPQHVVNFVQIHSNDDNKVILENLKDREVVLIKSYFPKVRRWIKQLSRYDSQNESLKRLIDLKVVILNCLSKSQDLVVQTDDDFPSTSAPSKNDGELSSDYESSDDDFIEVPEKVVALLHEISPDLQKVKKTQPADKPLPESLDVSVWKPIRPDDNMQDPTSYSRALAIQREVLKNDDASTRDPVKIHPRKHRNKSAFISNSDVSLNAAPIISYGPDLLEWDDVKKNELKESLSMGMAREMDIGHRFWSASTPSQGEKVSEAALTALTTRSIPFVGTFKPISHTCRAPLPSGKLCPRMDRLKCPFHGLIIPRDINGHPIAVENSQISTSKLCDWQDPELLRDLKSATGVDLQMPIKAKKRKQTQQHKNLTDLKNMKNTSRYRLQKKVLHPKSIKRVSETLDDFDTKRNFQKFGNNFNYALN